MFRGPLPKWATEDTYNDPGKSWDGQATKVVPSSEQNDQGYKPKQRPAAQRFNWILNNLSEYATNQREAHVCNWEPNDAPVFSSLCKLPQKPAWLLVTGDALQSSKDGRTWAGVGGSFSESVGGVVRNTDRAMVWKLRDGMTNAKIYSTDDADSFTDRGSVSGEILDACYDSTNSKFLFLADSQDNTVDHVDELMVYRRDGDGTGSTSVAYLDDSDSTADTNPAIAASSTGTAVVVAASGAYWYSVDGGVTWSAKLSIADYFATAVPHIVWSEFWQTFFIATSEGIMHAGDGQSWDLVESESFAPGASSLAVTDMGVFVATQDESYDGTQCGIFYSLDFGNNWYFEAITDDHAEIVAIDDGRVFTCTDSDVLRSFKMTQSLV